MASIFAGLAQALSVTNEVIGVPCSFLRPDDHMVTDDVMVILNKNKKVTDEFKMIVGFRNEANFLKSQHPHRPEPGDIITFPGGVEWRIGDVTTENAVKWYVDVREA
jgi:hypothetical protein